MADIQRWTTKVLRNEWSDVQRTQRHEHVVITDASKWGWGAITVDVATGFIRQYQDAWPMGYKARRKSSRTETDAIYRAIEHFFPARHTGTVKLLTDSKTAAFAYQKGRSMSYGINRTIRDMKNAFPHVTLELHYIEGAQNIANDLSRGKPMAEITIEHAKQIRAQLLGDLAPNSGATPERK
jgi:hypothetical protein